MTSSFTSIVSPFGMNSSSRFVKITITTFNTHQISVIRVTYRGGRCIIVFSTSFTIRTLLSTYSINISSFSAFLACGLSKLVLIFSHRTIYTTVCRIPFFAGWTFCTNTQCVCQLIVSLVFYIPCCVRTQRTLPCLVDALVSNSVTPTTLDGTVTLTLIIGCFPIWTNATRTIVTKLSIITFCTIDTSDRQRLFTRCACFTYYNWYIVISDDRPVVDASTKCTTGTSSTYANRICRP